MTELKKLKINDKVAVCYDGVMRDSGTVVNLIDGTCGKIVVKTFDGQIDFQRLTGKRCLLS